MSKYLTFEGTCFKDKRLLVAALTSLGLEVEIGAGLTLNGWMGEQQTADVVVRKTADGAWEGGNGLRNGDLGFRLGANGYSVIVDQHDLSIGLDPQHGGAGRWMVALKTAYNTGAVREIARRVQAPVRTTQKDGRIVMVVGA